MCWEFELHLKNSMSSSSSVHDLHIHTKKIQVNTSSHAIISGSRRHIDYLLRDQQNLFSSIDDFLWFKLSAVRDCPSGSSSLVLSDSVIPYTLDDFQSYLNKFESSYYTKNGKRSFGIFLYLAFKHLIASGCIIPV
ncbi:unnamed protein product [Vicia faba]|uniref:Nuclear pore protein n=1 Tax=Vicia faba TaxID=3906 RepID=A0AAV1A1Y1_VICFA|nr:unnamed protein product [Vicia faba]